jgi:hypothetical protein
MLTEEDATERLGVQNIGDLERVLRTSAGLVVMLTGSAAPRGTRWPFRLAGAALALSGLAGWCPGYFYAGVTSLEGPGDRPDEAHRLQWLTPAKGQPPSTDQRPGDSTPTGQAPAAR